MTVDGPPDRVAVILDALGNPSWAARVDALRTAAATLGTAKLDETDELHLVGPLVDASMDQKWEVRKEAAGALAECRHHEEVVHEALAKLERDPNRWVSQAAERATKRMRSRAARSKQWELTPDAQDPTLQHIMDRIREIGLRSMTPARIYDLAMEISEQSYRELAADTAHELRTMLTPFEGYLAELRKHLGSRGADATADRYLDAALDRLQKIQSLTDDLHDFSARAGADFAAVDVACVIRDGVALALHRDDNSESSDDTTPSIKRVIDVPTGLVVDAIRERLVRAIANLVANACQAMPQGGTLTVRARSESIDTVMITIVDTGHGMTPEQIEQARLRFNTTRRDEGGTGLGIPIAERIVKHDHRGDLAIESTPKIGTRVTLTLPSRRSIDR